MKRFAALLLIASGCSGDSTAPPVAYPVASMTGQYRVTFTAVGWGPGCDVISLDMTAKTWVPETCSNQWVVPDYTPAAVVVRNDSLFLHVTDAYSPLGDPRDIEFGYFNTQGSTDVIHAKWSGMMCHPISGSQFCAKETGDAVFRRP